MKRSMDKAVREPAVSVYALQLGIEVNSDSGFLDYLQQPLFDRAGGALLALVSGLATELNGMTTEKAPFLHQFHFDIKSGQFPGGCQASNAAPDDQDLLGCLAGRALSVIGVQQ
jgi:hypothetical protein